MKKDVLSVKFTGKHLRRGLYSGNMEVITKQTSAQVFSCKSCAIFKNIYLEELELMGGIEEKRMKQIWHVYLVLKYLGLR